MSFYETVYIVDPNLENKTLEKTMSEIGKELEKTNSRIINHRVWGKKRLAYPIDKQKYGSYIIIEYEGGDQEKMLEYGTWMKLNNSVLRHMTVVLENEPEVYVEEKKSKIETDGEEKSMSENSSNTSSDENDTLSNAQDEEKEDDGSEIEPVEEKSNNNEEEGE